MNQQRPQKFGVFLSADAEPLEPWAMLRPHIYTLKANRRNSCRNHGHVVVEPRPGQNAHYILKPCLEPYSSIQDYGASGPPHDLFVNFYGED
eukprot:scaffold10861_cov180-Amphora_coffeaeformis.AAC.12